MNKDMRPEFVKYAFAKTFLPGVHLFLQVQEIVLQSASFLRRLQWATRLYFKV